MIAAPRVFFVGTDTSVGKTSLVCELLGRAATLGVRALPYKPAQSGVPDAISDADRLIAASGNPGFTREHVLGLDFASPIAPGLAATPRSFLDEPVTDTAPLVRCRAQLDAAIDSLTPDLVLIEGAGGLWVPMPGGSWQPQWIRELATEVVVVARAGLGTINHTLCTIDALRGLDLEPLGFYLSETEPADPAMAINARVIECARGIPHLGTLPHHRSSDACLLTALLTRLAARSIA